MLNLVLIGHELKDIWHPLSIANISLRKVKIIAEVTNYLTQYKTQRHKLVPKLFNLQV